MGSIYPGLHIQKKWAIATSADNTALASTVTVTAKKFGVLYRLWVSADTGTGTDETDIENLVSLCSVSASIGSTAFSATLHPFIEHDTADTESPTHRSIDLGPWPFDFGEEGMYSGVLADNIVIGVGKMGTGIKTSVSYQYSS